MPIDTAIEAVDSLVSSLNDGELGESVGEKEFRLTIATAAIITVLIQLKFIRFRQFN